MYIHRSVFLAIVAFFALANTTSAITEACLPTNKREDGMNINFYEYMLGDSSTYTNPAYMSYGYANTKHLGSVSGQTELSIYYNSPCSSTSTCSDSSNETYTGGDWDLFKREDGLCDGGSTAVAIKRDTNYCDPNAAYWSSDLFGFYTTPTNVTLEMTGYFLPPENGSYTFSFSTVDDSAILSVGGATAFECCEQQQSPTKSTNFTVDAISGNTESSLDGSVYLYAGYYYPMKIVFSNAGSAALLPITMTLPNGSHVFGDFKGYVYSFDNNLTQADCTVTDPARHTIAGEGRTRTHQWTGTYTTTQIITSIYTGLNSLTTQETIFEIQTPTVVSSSIVTSTYSSAGDISTVTESSTHSEISSSSYFTTSSSTSSIVASSSVAASSTHSEISSSSDFTTSSSTSSIVASSSVAASSTHSEITSSSDFTTSSSTSSIAASSSATESSTHSEISSSSDFTTSSSTSSVAAISSIGQNITNCSESSTQPRATDSLTSTTHSTTPMYPSNQTVVTSFPIFTSELSSLSSSFGSSESALISTSTDLRLSTLDANDRSTATSSTDSNTMSAAPAKTGTINSPTTHADLVTSVSVSSDDLNSGTLTASKHSTASISVSPSEVDVGNFSTNSSKNEMTIVSSSFTLTTSGSSKSYESYKSSAIPLSDSTTESFESQTKPIASSSTYSKTRETTFISASISISSESTSRLSASSASTSRKITLSNETIITSYSTRVKLSDGETAVITPSSASYSNKLKSASDEITSAFYKDSTAVQKATSTAIMTSDQITLITVISCESGFCSKTASPAMISTATATVSGFTTEYATWCPISTTDSKDQTTLVTVISCESGVCSRTLSPAIVSTATTTIKDAVTAYTTWCPLTKNERVVRTDSTTKVSSTSTTSIISEASKPKTVTGGNSVSSISGSAEKHTTTVSYADEYNNDASFTSKTANTKGFSTFSLSTNSQPSRGTYTNGVIVSSTASLRISDYAGIANGLIANRAMSVFIASILLAII